MMIVGITSVAAISMGTSNCLAMRSLHAWDQGDRTNIDEALSHAMSDADLEHVIGQCLLRHRVYSEGQNGIVALSEPWKNVVATFYHELCEARRDPEDDDVIRSGNEKQLGWYSNKGGEIGDIPMSLAGAHLERVMVEAPLAKGGTAPVQLEWSNHVHGPEGPNHHPH